MEIDLDFRLCPHAFLEKPRHRLIFGSRQRISYRWRKDWEAICFLIQPDSNDCEISSSIQTPRLPKETALISGQVRTHDFPGIQFTSRGRCHASIVCKAASIRTMLTYYTRNRRIVAKFRFSGNCWIKEEKYGWRMVVKVYKVRHSK